jgi:hypothetical protein
MTDERRSGIALIAGSAAMIITMAFHPHGKITPAELDSMVRMLVGVHSLALASIPVLFLGAWGMSRWLAGPDRLSWAALVVFAVGCIAVMNAAIFDGLMAPYLMRQIVSATAEKRESWQMFMSYNFQMNQSFARVYAVASSLAVVLWSVSALRNRAMGWGIGIYGCIVGAVTAAGILSGLLRPDWHGFSLLILGQAIWFVRAGTLLYGVRDVRPQISPS